MSNVNLPPEDLKLIEELTKKTGRFGRYVFSQSTVEELLSIISRYQKALEVALDLSQGWNAERRRKVQDILEAK